jgi:hypothetical protein
MFLSIMTAPVRILEHHIFFMNRWSWANSTKICKISIIRSALPLQEMNIPPANILAQAHSTYICRVQSCVWRLPKYWPPRPPLPSPPSECILPPHQRRGGTHSPSGGGLEDARHWIGLLQYNLSTGTGINPGSSGFPLVLFSHSFHLSAR